MESRRKNGRTIAIAPERLLLAMNHRGLSVEKLACLADLSVGTINNMLAGKAVFRRNAAHVAAALETNLAVLLNDTGGPTASYVHEYLVAEVLSDWVIASNGLRFQTCKLRHSELERLARGKRFDLRELPTDEQQRCRTWIKRHPNVCAVFNDHPNIIRNLTAFPDPVEDYFWVIDEWIHGDSLQRKLKNSSFNEMASARLLLDISMGLKALHDCGIVRRELNPTTILIRDVDGRAVLTEFELAKLIDRGPTVSTDDWPVDPYRAGEADSDDIDHRADIYSWARIALHLLLGHLPEEGNEFDRVDRLRCPQVIRQLIVKSASVFRNDRPSSFDTIIPALQDWSE